MFIKNLKNNKRYLLFLILLVFISLRLINIYSRIQFNWDQERDAKVTKEILGGNFTLIGPRVLGPDNFFLGPYFYYLLAPFYWVSAGHPVAMVYFLIFNSLVFFFFAWFYLKEKYSPKTALIFLLFWAVNPALVKADTICWNPVVLPTLIILLWFLLNKIKTKKSKYYFLTGLLLSLGINFHFQFVFLILFTLAYFTICKIKSIKFWLTLASGFLLGFLPLAIFDLRHNFLNSKLLWNFLNRTTAAKNWLAFIPVVKNFFQASLGFTIPTAVAVLLLPAIGIYLLLKKKERYGCFALSLVLLVLLPIFASYGQRPSEYYFNFLYPFLILLLAKLTTRRNIAILLATVLVVFWGWQSTKLLESSSLGLYHKEKVVKYITSHSQNAVVHYNVPMGRDTGYRYLLDYYGVFDQQPKAVFQIIVPINQSQAVDYSSGDIGVKQVN